jgi:hypothetical protein
VLFYYWARQEEYGEEPLYANCILIENTNAVAIINMFTQTKYINNSTLIE